MPIAHIPKRSRRLDHRARMMARRLCREAAHDAHTADLLARAEATATFARLYPKGVSHDRP